MRKWLWAGVLALALFFLLPAAEAAGSGLTAEDPLSVPEEGLAVAGGTLYGIDAEWFTETVGEAGHRYLSVSVPETVTTIAFNGLTDSYTSDKEKHGALNYHSNPDQSYDLVGLDFSQATGLTDIDKQAAFNCALLTGELDLSHTQLVTIGKSAFSGCSGLTGVVLPDNLKQLGSENSGSVFSGCSGLQYIRLGDSGADTVFELPGTLTYIGRQTFKNCFAEEVEARVVIPASVATIGSEAFYSGRISQIVVKRQGDGWDSRYGGYDSAAFKTGNSGLLVLFNDNASYQDYSLNRKPISAVKRAMAHPVTLTFGDTGESQEKLNHQRLQYVREADTGFWVLDESYRLPALEGTPAARPGYDVSWTLDGRALTDTGTLETNQTSPKAAVSYALQDPTVAFSVDGAAQGSAELTVELDGQPHTAGVTVSHPLLLEEQGSREGEYVYFRYCWWDEYENSVNGPRSAAEPELFSTSAGGGVLNRVYTDRAEIPIVSTDHARTGSSQYMVEIYGYLVLNGAEPSLFYKSHYNFIDFGGDNDTEATVDRSYVFRVAVEGPAAYPITASAGPGGTISPSGTVQVPAGESQTFTIEAETGWHIQDVQVDGASVGAVGSHTFPAVEEAHTIHASFAQDPTGGGGDGTTYYTLRYVSNGGTEYDSERYRRGTVVTLDKVPVREGHTFTGWYADQALTQAVTQVKMTSGRTVYAGWAVTEVPGWLNGTDHFAYIIGYDDGTVRPLDPISRAETASLFFRLLRDEVREDYLTGWNTFQDVEEGAWYHTAVSTLARMGVLEGRSAAVFDPDASITRGEFAALCARFDRSDAGTGAHFTDISGHWAEEEICRAAALGWVQGRGDGTFCPDAPITRAEAMALVNRVLGRLPEGPEDLLEGMRTWPDNQDPDAWYYLPVQEATNSHQFQPKADGAHETWTGLTDDPDWKRYE